MTHILDKLCHGYTSIPLIVTLKKQGFFEALNFEKPTPLATLVETLNANKRYLTIGLDLFEGAGWVSQDTDEGYQLASQAQAFANIPESILDLYHYEITDSLISNDKFQELLQFWIEHQLEYKESDPVFQLLLGPILVPLLILGCQQNAESDDHQLVFFLKKQLNLSLRKRVFSLLALLGWVTEGEQVVLTDLGRETLLHAYALGGIASFRPMLAHLDQLLFGESPHILKDGAGARVPFIDRRLNWWANSLQHKPYFDELEKQILALFDHEVPFEKQPKYIAEVGCGKGAFLKKIYGVLGRQTERGKNFQEFPLTLIAIDDNEEALAETEKALQGLPHIILKGDIAKPENLFSDLKQLGINEPETILLICSFSDNHFQNSVSSLNKLQNFDALNAFAGQLSINAESFLVAAANVGLFAKTQPIRYSKTLLFRKVFLSCFEARDYTIRLAKNDDLPDLNQLETLCWAHSKTPKTVIQQRLDEYPEGQFVLELDQHVVGVIYSQRIPEIQSLKGVTEANISTLHDPKGPHIQLIRVNIHPHVQERSLGDQLLEFMLQCCSLMSGVQSVIAVTLCKDYTKDGLYSVEEYIHLQDDRGMALDPILGFHQSHGASIRYPLAGYRPQDEKNEGYGVLVQYDIHNRVIPNLHHKVATSPSQNTTPAKKFAPEKVQKIEKVVHDLIIDCLGNENKEAFSPHRPLMEMGLDSADLSVLKGQIFREYPLELDPAFFFEHNTPAKVVKYLHDSIEGSESNELPPSLSQSSERKNVINDENYTKSVPTKQKGIAIVGVSCKLPGKIHDPEEFWVFLRDGRSGIGELPKERFSWPLEIDPIGEHQGIDKGGFLEDIASFDPYFFRISPKEAEGMDPQQRILLELTWQCLEDAGYPPQSIANSETGVFIGASGSDYDRMRIEENITIDGHSGTGSSVAILPNRISYFFDFSGPSLLIDTACSSSLVAVHKAVQALYLEECEQALVGAINIICHPANSIAYYQAGMLAKDGQCKTFDHKANGYVRSEGAVMLLLKSLPQAISDEDQIYALIRGSACNHGGQAGGLTVPNPEKQAKLLQKAWGHAEIAPETLGLFETHGTGTSLGDPIEIQGIKKAYQLVSDSVEKSHEGCALGAVKSNLGHLEAASGMVGLLKVCLSLRYQEIVPNIQFDQLNPQIDLAGSSFFIATKLQKWPLPKQRARRGAVSNFGSGGANGHVVLEEYLSQGSFENGEREVFEPEANPLKPAIILISAKNRDRLQAYVEKLLEFIKRDRTWGDPSYSSRINLSNLAYTLQVGREAMEERLGVVVESMEELAEKLKGFIEGREEIEGLYVGRIQDFPKAPISTEDLISQGQLGQLVNLWVQGLTFDWNTLYGECPEDQKPKRISVPTYPFSKEVYWMVQPNGQPTDISIDRTKSTSFNNQNCSTKGPTMQVKQNKSTNSGTQELPFSVHEDKSTPLDTTTNLTCKANQKKFIDKFITNFEAKTKKSKQSAIQYRKYFSDQRTPIFFNPLLKEIHYPITYEEANGAYLYDIDGNKYIDIACDYGVNLFGHNPTFLSQAMKSQIDKGMALTGRYDAIGKAAKLFCEITGKDRVLFCQSGTESLMSALRLARAFTGKSKVVIFEGSYHGHYDSFLSAFIPGVAESLVSDTLVMKYGDVESLGEIIKQSSEIAAIIVEPVQSSQINCQPVEFLRSLRQLATQEEIVLIFDEMITSFRIHPQGCQGYFGVQGDLATYGKILGGGITAGAVAGKEEIMRWADGGIWQYGDQSQPQPIAYMAGTHTQNPLKLAATLAILEEIKKQSPDLQNELNAKTEFLSKEINHYITENRLPMNLVHFGSQFRFKFLLNQFSLTQALFLYLLNDYGLRYNLHGNCFLTTAHTDSDVHQIIYAVKKSLDILLNEEFFYRSTEPPALSLVNDNSPPPKREPHFDNKAAYHLFHQASQSKPALTLEEQIKIDLKEMILSL